jgi:hypothetical protein
MNVLEIVQQIIDNLTDDLRRKPWKGSRNNLKGHCYVASEAFYHLVGGKEAGWTPMFVWCEGIPHWYLRFDSGAYLDITAGQFRRNVPYYKGIGKGFLTKKPSKRAQILIDRVNNGKAKLD